MAFNVLSRETPLGPGAKKDGCFRRLTGFLDNSNLTRGRNFLFQNQILDIEINYDYVEQEKHCFV